MTPLEFDKKYSYRVGKKDEIYIVSVGDVGFSVAHLCGDLSLDKVTGRKDVRVWTPRSTNVFAFRRERRDILQRELFLEKQVLDGDFKFFFEFMNHRLRSKYGNEISFGDAKIFFKKLHNHYSDIRKHVHPEDRPANPREE